MKTILITGGLGFIGSNFLNLFVLRHPDFQFINLDKITYSANPSNVTGLDGLDNYKFIKEDIANSDKIVEVFRKYEPEVVIHFAAETHVDRSISNPGDFIRTNIIGTFNLLEATRTIWEDYKGKHFHHVSTDEVYGSLGNSGKFTEKTSYNPSSPYSASKASSDHLVRAYHKTYDIPTTITNCSNNYGPYQFPEKLIPLMIVNALRGKNLPIYGSGQNVRDWLYVADHCNAIWHVIEKGKSGETYNVGGNNERTNIEIVTKICDILAEEKGVNSHYFKKLVQYVKDRPGHDFRYAIDSTKINRELKWRPEESFDSGLRKTVKWYINNIDWVDKIKTKKLKMN